ncbi:MAG: hypothetical protein DIU76_04650, partial [Bacillota bacterium]
MRVVPRKATKPPSLGTGAFPFPTPQEVSPMGDVILYDTTLRDGTQRAGIHLTLADKLRLARRLDAFGIPYVEGGWPGSNPKDAAFFRALQDQPLERARLVAFTSTRRPGRRVQDDPALTAALDAATPASINNLTRRTIHPRELRGVPSLST